MHESQNKKTSGDINSNDDESNEDESEYQRRISELVSEAFDFLTPPDDEDDSEDWAENVEKKIASDHDNILTSAQESAEKNECSLSTEATKKTDVEEDSMRDFLMPTVSINSPETTFVSSSAKDDLDEKSKEAAGNSSVVTVAVGKKRAQIKAPKKLKEKRLSVEKNRTESTSQSVVSSIFDAIFQEVVNMSSNSSAGGWLMKSSQKRAAKKSEESQQPIQVIVAIVSTVFFNAAKLG